MDADPPPLRIVVVGSSGAGKSTLARELARLAAVPHVELDALFWGPAWEPVMPAQFREAVTAAVAADAWVVDGNYGLVRGFVWSRATAVVWLNLPLYQVFFRVLLRTLRRWWRSELLWGGNRETLRRALFSRESILRWVLRTYRRRQREFAALREGGEYPNLRWIECRRSPTAAEVLAALQPPSQDHRHVTRAADAAHRAVAPSPSGRGSKPDPAG